MSHVSTYEMPFRRRRREKTNYRKRLALLKSKMLRFVVRKSNNHTTCQFVKYNREGDETIATAHSSELAKLGWKGHGGNIPSAYLSGYLCGLKGVKKGVKNALLDIGLATPVHGSRIFAALKGVIDAGISIKHDEKVFPTEDRISGKHINKETPEIFEKVKNNIAKEYGEKK